MSEGGEASPLCNSVWPGFSEAVYLAYVKEMMDYIAAQNPPMNMLADLHATGVIPQKSYADSEAYYAIENGKMGFGTNGLQVADTSKCLTGACASGSDWYSLFGMYQDSLPVYGGNPVRLSLQTLQVSDPTGVQATGSLIYLLPFAKARGANNMEIYTCDLLLAYDPDYASTSCNTKNPGYGSYSAAYSSAIATYVGSTTTGLVLNTNEYNAATIYPNPSSGSFVLETNSPEYRLVRVFDMNGKLVLISTLHAGKTSVDASGLAQGVYAVCISGKDEHINKRLVILK